MTMEINYFSLLSTIFADDKKKLASVRYGRFSTQRDWWDIRKARLSAALSRFRDSRPVGPVSPISGAKLSQNPLPGISCTHLKQKYLHITLYIQQRLHTVQNVRMLATKCRNPFEENTLESKARQDADASVTSTQKTLQRFQEKEQ